MKKLSFLIATLALTGCETPIPPQEPPASEALREYIREYRNESLRENVERESYIRSNLARSTGHGWSQGLREGGAAPHAKKKKSTKKHASQKDQKKPIKPSGYPQSFV